MDRLLALTVFAKVVEQGSFVRAAERLEMSASAVSRHVADLEAHLDTRLLNRTTRRLSLTESGRAFHERCVQLLADLEEAELSANAGTAKPRGTLRLTCSITFGARHLAQAIGAFVREYPEMRFDIELSDHAVDLSVRVDGPIHANNGRFLTALAVNGVGIAYEPDFVVGPDIRAGRLVPLLVNYVPAPTTVYVVYPSRRHLSAKVRVFAEFLAQ